MKNLITKVKDTIADWWCNYGDEIIIVFLAGTTVLGAAATSYWRGKYSGVIENRNH